MKYYKEPFKNDKVKNILKQVLLNISDISTFDIPFNCKNLSDFLEEILKSDQ